MAASGEIGEVREGGGLAEDKEVTEERKDEVVVDGDGDAAPAVEDKSVEDEKLVAPEEQVGDQAAIEQGLPAAIVDNAKEAVDEEQDKEVDREEQDEKEEQEDKEVDREEEKEEDREEEKEEDREEEKKEELPAVEETKEATEIDKKPASDGEEAKFPEEQVPVEEKEVAAIGDEKGVKMPLAFQEEEEQVPVEVAKIDAELPVEQKLEAVEPAAVEIEKAEEKQDKEEVKVDEKAPQLQETDTNSSGDQVAEEKHVNFPQEQAPEANEDALPDRIAEAIALEAASFDGFVHVGTEVKVEVVEEITEEEERNGFDSRGGDMNTIPEEEKKSKIKSIVSWCFPEFHRLDSHSWTSGLALGIIATCTAVVVSKHLYKAKSNS